MWVLVYLFTNRLYEREHIYKYGITINPFQRKRVQNNSAPPTCALYDIIVMFSKSYKEIEKFHNTKHIPIVGNSYARHLVFDGSINQFLDAGTPIIY